MRVKVWKGDTHESLGCGTLTHYEEVKFEGYAPMKTPVITLDSGEVIKGYACWWEKIEPESIFNDDEESAE